MRVLEERKVKEEKERETSAVCGSDDPREATAAGRPPPSDCPPTDRKLWWCSGVKRTGEERRRKDVERSQKEKELRSQGKDRRVVTKKLDIHGSSR